MTCLAFLSTIPMREREPFGNCVILPSLREPERSDYLKRAVMSSRAKVLLLDDDIWFARGFRARFAAAFPDVQLDSDTEPTVKPGYAVYFVDNDFGGKILAGELARQIRALDPDALVIAISASLDAVTLKTLINLGCNGAFDKSTPSSLQEAFEVVRKYLDAQAALEQEKSKRRGFGSTISSIASLLTEWNRRFDSQVKIAESSPKD
jgi:DNA-binding NarL/FixJ family response regulator